MWQSCHLIAMWTRGHLIKCDRLAISSYVNVLPFHWMRPSCYLIAMWPLGHLSRYDRLVTSSSMTLPSHHMWTSCPFIKMCPSWHLIIYYRLVISSKMTVLPCHQMWQFWHWRVWPSHHMWPFFVILSRCDCLVISSNETLLYCHIYVTLSQPLSWWRINE